MPWSPAQHRLFEFVAHNPGKARAEGIKVKPGDAARMASEGIKRDAKSRLSSALRGKGK
jgi:hypothetical protein